MQSRFWQQAVVTGLFSAVNDSEFELPNLDPLSFEHVLQIISTMLQKQKEPLIGGVGKTLI